MLAYIFWHIPRSGIDAMEYEAALLAFQASLIAASLPGLAGCATFRTSELPWLGGQRGYEDWYLMRSASSLDDLNRAAVEPRRWDVHAEVASRMDVGRGGLYYYLLGNDQELDGTRVVWLKRPRGIRFEEPLRNIIAGSDRPLSCWRMQMLLGPTAEFAIVGNSPFNLSVPAGWQTQTVDRTLLVQRTLFA